MLNKVKNIIVRNIGLKILAAILAVILWLVVLNIEDPDKSKIFTIPVTIENADYLQSQGMTYTVENNSDTVSFYVTAKRSIIDNLSTSDFVATADMSKVINNEQIPITITSNRYVGRLTIESDEKYVEIATENLEQKQFEVKANFTGELAAGYVIGETGISPNVVEVTGPQSVVEQIASVEVRMDVTGCSQNIQERLIPVLLDENGDEVSIDRLKLNWDELSVLVEIQKSKSVPVTLPSEAEGGENVRILSMEPSVQEVRVYGDRELLDDFNSVEIPESALELSEITENTKKKVDITSYLPEGILLVDKENAEIMIDISVETVEEKQYEIPVSNIVVEDLSSGWVSSIEGVTVSLTVSGYPSDLKKLSMANIRGTVDGSDFTPGSNVGEVVFDLGDEYTVVKASKVSVVVVDSGD